MLNLRPSYRRLALYPGGAVLLNAAALIAYRARAGHVAAWDWPSYLLATATLGFALILVIQVTVTFDDEGLSQLKFIGRNRIKWVDVLAIAHAPDGRFLRIADAKSIVSLQLWAYPDKEELVRRVKQQLQDVGNNPSEVFQEINAA